MLQTIVNQACLESAKKQALVLWFDEVDITDIALVGSKNASLGEMIQQLTPKGINVSTGFAITAYAYRYFIEKVGLEEELRQLFSDLDVEDINNLRERGEHARALILHTPFPEELASAIKQAYFKLCKHDSHFAEFCKRSEIHYREACELYSADTHVAIRSSATAEDPLDTSFVGQQETYLNVQGPRDVIEACHKCFASLFTDSAICYRAYKGFDHFDVSISVAVQKMVGAALATSG